MIVGLCSSMPAQASEVVRSDDGKRMAWTIPHGDGHVLYTEIWIGEGSGADGRRIRSYLGEVTRLSFHPNGRELVCLQHSLRYTLFGSYLTGGRYSPIIRSRIRRLGIDGSSDEIWPLPEDMQAQTIALAPNGRQLAVGGFRGDLLDGSDAGLWIIDRNGKANRLARGRVSRRLRWAQDPERVLCVLEEDDGGRPVAIDVKSGAISDGEPVAPGADESTMGGHRGPGSLSPDDRRAALVAQVHVARARNYYMKAYNTMHRADYIVMERDLLIATATFKELHKLGVGLTKEDCKAYTRAMKEQTRGGSKGCADRACREHMILVGDLMSEFAAAHGDSLPPVLEDVLEWAEGRAKAETSDEREKERDLRVLRALFRCSADQVPVQRTSYVYRPETRPDGRLLSAYSHRSQAAHLMGPPGRYRVVTEPIGAAQADSLEAVADRYLEEGRPDRAIPLLGGVANQRMDGSSFAKLGHVHLANRYDHYAEETFQKALTEGRGSDLAEAYYGMGLIYMNYTRGYKRSVEKAMAADYFLDALKRDPNHKEARFQKAKAKYEMKWIVDSKDEIGGFMKRYPDHAEAVLLMGDWYADLAEEYDKAIVWYTRYLLMRPDDPRIARRLGVAYLELRDYDRIMDSLLGFTQEHPEAVELIPIVAQACFKKEKLELAFGMFQEYLSKTKPEVREFFEDIELISSREEFETFRYLPEEDRGEYLKRFWNDRDPDLSTPVNERLLEHYRRVWYARTHFADGKEPWDARGVVYIRFGEPDHRTRSTMMNLEQTLGVQRVKERMAYDLYGSEAASESYLGSVYPIRSRSFGGQLDVDRNYDATAVDYARKLTDAEEFEAEAEAVLSGEAEDQEQEGTATEAEAGAAAIGAGTGQDPYEYWFRLSEYRPVTTSNRDLSNVPWESWTYTKVGGGIEITFTDESFSGVYEYAPVPLAPDLSFEQMRKFARYAPRSVFDRAAAITPDHYAAEYAAEPYEFYFDLADFRGPGGNSTLEVYYGMPNESGRYRAEANVTEMVVTRQAAAVPTNADTVYRESDHLVYRAEGDRRVRGAFIPDVERLAVPPGVYRLEVKARNRLDGKLGIYRKAVVVKNYRREDLLLSDLQLAFHISEAGGENKFTKGGLQVIPLPTRKFRKGRPVFVYYEIYNLTRDEFGQTRYSVEYTVRPRVGINLGSIVSRLAQTFSGGKREQVAVGYEQIGLGESEVAYVELDLGDTHTGRYEVRVEVTDLNSGKMIGKETTFQVAD
jgi:GWxTD domain-containing protein